MMIDDNPMNNGVDDNETPHLNGTRQSIHGNAASDSFEFIEEGGFEYEDETEYEDFGEDGELWFDEEDEFLMEKTHPQRNQSPLISPQLLGQYILQTQFSSTRPSTPSWFKHPINQPVHKSASAGLKDQFRQMQRLALLAANAKNQTEAVALASAIIPLALQQSPSVEKQLNRIMVDWIQMTALLVKQLEKHSSTKMYIAALPAIIWRAAAILSRLAIKKQVTITLGRQVLAKQTNFILNHIQRLNRNSNGWNEDAYFE